MKNIYKKSVFSIRMSTTSIVKSVYSPNARSSCWDILSQLKGSK